MSVTPFLTLLRKQYSDIDARILKGVSSDSLVGGGSDGPFDWTSTPTKAVVKAVVDAAELSTSPEPPPAIPADQIPTFNPAPPVDAPPASPKTTDSNESWSTKIQKKFKSEWVKNLPVKLIGDRIPSKGYTNNKLIGGAPKHYAHGADTCVYKPYIPSHVQSLNPPKGSGEYISRVFDYTDNDELIAIEYLVMIAKEFPKLKQIFNLPYAISIGTPIPEISKKDLRECPHLKDVKEEAMHFLANLITKEQGPTIYAAFNRAKDDDKSVRQGYIQKWENWDMPEDKRKRRQHRKDMRQLLRPYSPNTPIKDDEIPGFIEARPTLSLLNHLKDEMLMNVIPALVTINKRGIYHNDLHFGNVAYMSRDYRTAPVVVFDFGRAQFKYARFVRQLDRIKANDLFPQHMYIRMFLLNQLPWTFDKRAIDFENQPQATMDHLLHVFDFLGILGSWLKLIVTLGSSGEGHAPIVRFLGAHEQRAMRLFSDGLMNMKDIPVDKRNYVKLCQDVFTAYTTGGEITAAEREQWRMEDEKRREEEELAEDEKQRAEEEAKAKAQVDVTPAADYVSPVSTVIPLEVSSSFSPPAPTKKRPRVEEGKPTVPSPFA